MEIIFQSCSATKQGLGLFNLSKFCKFYYQEMAKTCHSAYEHRTHIFNTHQRHVGSPFCSADRE